jgi:hypothetical protein
MNKLAKKLLGAGAAAAALAGMSVPAQARDYYDRDRDGISAGEVIAGAVVLGGIAAVLSNTGKNDRYDERYRDRDYRRGDDRYDRGYGYGYNNNGGSRIAINQCVRGVESYAGRYNRSKVTEVQNIERTRYGYKIRGNVVVQDSNRGGYDRYGRDDRYYRGDNYDRDDRRYNRDGYDRGYDRGYDQGRFTCYVERGQVTDIQYRGLDRWR